MERRNDNKAIFMYKIRKGEYLERISNTFKVANNQTYGLRNNNFDYALDKPKRNLLKKLLFIRVLKRGMRYQDLLRLATSPKGILGVPLDTDGLMDNCKVYKCL